MKVIITNLVSAVTAASENALYPDDNLLDEHPKKIWQAANGVTHTSLTVSIGASTEGSAAGIAIFNTNATSAIINLSDPNEVIWVDSDWIDVEWPSGAPQESVLLGEINSTSNAVWATYTGAETALEADIILDGDETLYAGVVVAGTVVSFTEPRYGIQEGLIDYSIRRELSNGAIYHKKRDVVRTFAAEIMPYREDEFYTFMHTLARENSYAPMAWRLTDQTGFDWTVYARLEGMPSGVHAYPTISPIQFSIREEL